MKDCNKCRFRQEQTNYGKAWCAFHFEEHKPCKMHQGLYQLKWRVKQ